MFTAADFPNLSDKQVLIVDDNDDSLELMAFILNECQIKVMKARSVAEAMMCLKQSRPDLLITDISMPEEDGYVLIEKVKQLTAEQGWQLPAIALTAFAATDEQRRLLQAGFQVRLTKPVDPDRLLVAVQKMIADC